MRINQVTVANHSRIADLALEIRRHAVIIGANDVGKTSLLRLLNLLLGASVAAAYQQLDMSDLRDPAVPLVVGATLVDFEAVDRAAFANEMDIDADTHSESLRVQMTVGAADDDPQALTVRRWFPDAGHDRGPTRDQLACLGWRYLTATRSASGTALDGPSSALQTLLSAVQLGAERTELEGLLSGFNTKLGTSGALGQLREQAASHLSRSMPRTVAKDDLAVRTAADPVEDLLGGVSMYFRTAGEHRPLSDQSDGVRQLMALTLFDLAEHAANVVAIDEPELHLHPSSQRTVAELLAAASNQKVLVTHSPFVVQRFEPSDVIAVDRDRRCHQVSAENLTAVEKVRANWWSPRLLEVLTARYVIVVEGLSDRIVVERAAALAGIHLDRVGAVVFDIDGADKFPHVYKLLGPNGFGVSLLGLVDEREKGIWHGAVGGKPAAVFGSVVWASNPDLEAEYCNALGGPAAAQALIDGGVCRPEAILASAAVTALDDVTVEAAAAYCRKQKVLSATAIAAAFDPGTAAAISSVGGLLAQLRLMSSE